MDKGAKRYGRVVVLMGGWSSERAISLRSGRAVLDSLHRAGVDAFGLDESTPVGMMEALMRESFDRAFIAMHGKGGEDGVVQAALEMLQKPYTGSRFNAAALCMNKLASKRLWLNDGVATPDFVVLQDGFNASAVVERLGLPLYVKPISEGSSIGVSRVTDASQLNEAWRKAGGATTCVLAEAAMESSEIAIGFVGEQWLPPIKIETPRAFYDYIAKYESSDTRYLCPSGLTDAQIREATELAQRGASLVGASGWGRADLMTDNDGKFYLLEVNVVPGMTEHSLVPKAAAHIGMDFDALVRAILDTAVFAADEQGVGHAHRA